MVQNVIPHLIPPTPTTQCGAFLRLGLAHGDCTTAFSGHVLRLCVFGSAVDNARRAADIASIGKLVVTEDIAVHITKMHTNNKRTYAVCHHTDSLYTLVDKEDTTTRGIQPFAAQHRFWLWFCNSPLEHQFTLHHNALYIGTERVWMGVGILMCAIYARRVLSEGYTDAPLMKASLAFLASEILTLFQSLLLRTWFLRHREAWATIHRLAMVIMISGASGKMQGVERLVLGYGATAMMMNAIGHKVRFHLQLVLSLITCSIGLCWMFNDHWYGGGRVSAAQPFMLVLVTVVLPGLLVWCVDRSSRRAFTACKLR